MFWLAPVGAVCCFLIYVSGLVPPGMNDLTMIDARVVQMRIQ